MTANELVTVARLADYFENQLSAEHDPLEVAQRVFRKFKADAPELWRFLRDSSRSDRQIGDWLYEFFGRYKESGMSLKNFAAEEFEQHGGGVGLHHISKKKIDGDLMRCSEDVVDRSPFPHKKGREKHQCKRTATACLTPATRSSDVHTWLCEQHAEAKLAKRDLLDRPIWRRC